jgi:hypothetical protein
LTRTRVEGAFSRTSLLSMLYEAFGRTIAVTPAKLIVGLLLLFFACAELMPAFRRVNFRARYLPLGGLVSGYFGGLAGMQGALRSAFLVKAGLTKEAYVATGAAIAFLIDVSRLSVYSQIILEHSATFDLWLLTAAVVSAFLGATLGNQYLPKITMGDSRNRSRAALRRRARPDFRGAVTVAHFVRFDCPLPLASAPRVDAARPSSTPDDPSRVPASCRSARTR